jgi:hypothetical protein
MFSNSPVKNVVEKLNPYSQKNKISRLKFERKSDYRTFLKFIKDNTKEVEDIKLPDEKKKTGLLAAGGLGLGLLTFAAIRGSGSGSGLEDGENVAADALEKSGMQSQKIDKNIKRKSNVKSGEDVFEEIGFKRLEKKRFKEEIVEPKRKKKKIEKKYSKERAKIKNIKKRKNIIDELFKEEKRFNVETEKKSKVNKTIRVKPTIGDDDTKKIVKSITDRLDQIEAENKLKNKFDPKAEGKVLDAQMDPDLKKLDRINKGQDALLDAINKGDVNDTTRNKSSQRRTRATIDRSKFFEAPEIPKRTVTRLNKLEKFTRGVNKITKTIFPVASFLSNPKNYLKFLLIKDILKVEPLADGTLEGKPGVGIYDSENYFFDEDTAVNIFDFSEERESMIPFDSGIDIPSVTTPTDLQTPKNNVFIDYEFNTTEDMFFIKMAGS